MSAPRSSKRNSTVGDVCLAMESVAPTALAQSWDNVGLLAGDARDRVRKVLACIDLTAAVLDEAVKKQAQLILAYHPPIFRPVSSLRGDGTGTDAIVHRCIRRGIAIYATHTALDAADGGTNDVIAEMCGIRGAEPLEYVEKPGLRECKVVVFVPPEQLDRVSGAMFDAGAGRIGDYTRCSYRLCGQGTFLGGASTNPAVGSRGRMEYVDEVRLETVVSTDRLHTVVSAMVAAHPYEEPAFDIYPLTPRPARGIGRCGRLPQRTTLARLARKLKRGVQAGVVQVVGDHQAPVERAVIVVGAAGSLPFRTALTRTDVIVTGEIRHHDALSIERVGCTAVALGHFTSERPVLVSLSKRLAQLLPDVRVEISRCDREPFRAL